MYLSREVLNGLPTSAVFSQATWNLLPVDLGPWGIARRERI